MAKLKLVNLPRKDVLAHIVDYKEDNYYDDEINIFFDGAMPSGDVTKGYVDQQDASILQQAKTYTDEELAKAKITKLYTDFGNNEDGSVTQKFFTEQVQSVQTSVSSLRDEKQDKLVSGDTIKTVNGNSLLGSGNVEIEGTEPETLTQEEFNNIWEQS